MAEHLTEEEQIESIKRWWNENWASVVLPIAAAILLYVGWNYWDGHKREQAQIASDQYQSLMNFVNEIGDSEFTETQRSQIKSLALEIRSDHEGTLYADMSGFLLAKIAVEQGNLAEAEAVLRDINTNSTAAGITQISAGRLAKVLTAQEKYGDALALVSTPVDESVKALYAEIRGDIFAAQGELPAATTAYEEALAIIPPQQFAHRGLIQFKLDGVRSTDPDVTSTEVE